MKNYSDWLTKAETAQRLQCSAKTIERLARAGRIQQKQRTIPGRSRPLPIYNPQDIERLESELLSPQAFPVDEVEADPEAQPSRLPVKRQEAATMAVNLFQHLAEAQTQVRTAEKLYLTLIEAAELSGLPKSYLLRLIKAEKLPAFKFGGWRIRRRDLEEL